ncbi:hypothetical protein QOT17_004760 [Balamuthia mandrillaris]
MLAKWFDTLRWTYNKAVEFHREHKGMPLEEMKKQVSEKFLNNGKTTRALRGLETPRYIRSDAADDFFKGVKTSLKAGRTGFEMKFHGIQDCGEVTEWGKAEINEIGKLCHRLDRMQSKGTKVNHRLRRHLRRAAARLRQRIRNLVCAFSLDWDLKRSHLTFYAWRLLLHPLANSTKQVLLPFIQRGDFVMFYGPRAASKSTHIEEAKEQLQNELTCLTTSFQVGVDFDNKAAFWESFDEFDLIYKAPSDVVDSLLNVLRGIKQDRANYVLHSLVAVGPFSILELTGRSASPFNVKEAIRVPLFVEDDFQKVFEEFNSDRGKVFDSNIPTDIYEHTRGYLPCYLALSNPIIANVLLFFVVVKTGILA